MASLRGKVKDLKRMQSCIAKRILATYKRGDFVVWEPDEGDRVLGQVIKLVKWHTLEINAGSRKMTIDLGTGNLKPFTGDF